MFVTAVMIGMAVFVVMSANKLSAGVSINFYD